METLAGSEKDKSPNYARKSSLQILYLLRKFFKSSTMKDLTEQIKEISIVKTLLTKVDYKLTCQQNEIKELNRQLEIFNRAISCNVKEIKTTDKITNYVNRHRAKMIIRSKLD